MDVRREDFHTRTADKATRERWGPGQKGRDSATVITRHMIRWDGRSKDLGKYGPAGSRIER